MAEETQTKKSGQKTSAGSLHAVPGDGENTVGDMTTFSKIKARDHMMELLSKIHLAHLSGDDKRVKNLVRLYLKSYAARYFAVADARRKMPARIRPPESVVFGCAKSLNAWVGSDDPIELHLKQKAGDPDHFRPILSFGLEHRALQLLVRRVLEAQADLHPNQYATRGIHAAIRRLIELMKDGHHWAIETDITQCYQSFDGEKIAEQLPIPKEVTRRSLLGAHLSLTLCSDIFGPADPGEDDELTFPELFSDARRGLPQGSGSSPLVAEMLLAPLFESLPKGSAVVGYADNFLAVGQNESDVRSTTETLRSALKAHPAGHLVPKPPRVFEPGGAIQFLGHRLMCTWGGAGRPHRRSALGVQGEVSGGPAISEEGKHQGKARNGGGFAAAVRAFVVRRIPALHRHLGVAARTAPAGEPEHGSGCVIGVF